MGDADGFRGVFSCAHHWLSRFSSPDLQERRTMCLRASLFVLACLLALAVTAPADTWATPKPRDYTSPSRNRTFKVVPPQNWLFGQAQGTLVLHGKQGKDRTLWQRKLVNLPHQAFVSDHSDHVVTIDTYGRLGYQHSLVLYGKDGKVLADYQLEDLLSDEESRRHVVRTASSQRWANGKFGFSADGKEFVARLDWGKVIRIDLAKPPPSKPRKPFDIATTAPATMIWSGNALNQMLRDLQAVRQGPEIVLPPEVLRHINVMKEGGKGSLALVRNGARLEWPMALRHDDFQAARKQIDTLLPRAIEKVRKQEPISTRELAEAVKQFKASLDQKADDLRPATFIESKRFLNQIEQTVVALGEPDAHERLKGSAEILTKGKTVASLVAFMKERKFQFAPATADGRHAYTSLYKSFARYLNAVHRPKKE
jgi:hypothetical protein